jgi:LL-H family phage holin
MQEIINIVAPVLATIIVALVATVLRSADKWLKTNVSSREYSILAAIAGTAVLAVEKQFVGEESDLKKSFAHQYADSLLASKGIKLDHEAVDAAIEAAVYQHFGNK